MSIHENDFRLLKDKSYTLGSKITAGCYKRFQDDISVSMDIKETHGPNKTIMTRFVEVFKKI